MNDPDSAEFTDDYDYYYDPENDPNYARYPIPFSALTESTQQMILEQRASKERPERPNPMRVLVRTRTHLVSGADADEKITEMCHRISKHQFGYEISPFDSNVNFQGCEFGYNNRPCWFLMDHGEHPTGSHDPALVPMKVYGWDGEQFHEYTQPLCSEIRAELKRYVFMPTDEQRNWVERPEKSPIEGRKFIRRKLRKMVTINDKDIDFIRENPEHAEWLEAHVRPRFWHKFQALIKEREQALAKEQEQPVTNIGSSQEQTVLGHKPDESLASPEEVHTLAGEQN